MKNETCDRYMAFPSMAADKLTDLFHDACPNVQVLEEIGQSILGYAFKSKRKPEENGITWLFGAYFCKGSEYMALLFPRQDDYKNQVIIAIKGRANIHDAEYVADEFRKRLDEFYKKLLKDTDLYRIGDEWSAERIAPTC